MGLKECPQCRTYYISRKRCRCSPQRGYHSGYSESEEEIGDDFDELLELMDEDNEEFIQKSSPNNQRGNLCFKRDSSQDIQTKRGSVACLTDVPSDRAEFIPQTEEHPVGVSSISMIHSELRKYRDLDTFKVEDQRGIQSQSEDLSHPESCSGQSLEGESNPASSTNASDSVTGPSGALVRV